MRPLRWLLPAALCSLCGCSGLLHSDAPALQLYVLQPPATSEAVQHSGPSLRIARPLAAPGLNTDRIALTRSGNRLDYYAGSRWSGPLADVVQELELAVFRADGTWSAIADDRSNFNTDYLLQTSVEAFAADYSAASTAPQVQVNLHGLLIRRSDGTLLGSFAVAERETAQENRMGSVVAAFSAAADRAVGNLVRQADESLRSAKSPAAP